MSDELSDFTLIKKYPNHALQVQGRVQGFHYRQGFCLQNLCQALYTLGDSVMSLLSRVIHRLQGIDVMTHKTSTFTKQLLMFVSMVLFLALVFVLEVGL